MSKQSYRAEQAVKNLGQSLGWKIPRLPSPEKMLDKLKEIKPERYQRVQEKCQGDLDTCSSWDILDLAYGLDLVFILPSGEVLGIDVTLHLPSSMEFQSKVRKLTKLEELHKSLGIHRTAVFNPNEMLLSRLQV